MKADAIANALHLPIRGLTFARPEALYLLGAIGILLAWWLWQARTPIRSIAPTLRAIVLALFVAALADPHSVMRSEGSARPAMIDASASITSRMREFTANLLRRTAGRIMARPATPSARCVRPASSSTSSRHRARNPSLMSR